MPLLYWEIATRTGIDALPQRIATDTPPQPIDRLPPEIGLLLPAREEDRTIDTRLSDIPDPAATAVGLFMASPFLNPDRIAKRLRDQGVDWIANFPSVDQQDPEFGQQLGDVGLDRTREFDALTAFSDLGLSALAVLCDASGCTGALACDPKAVLTVPRVADFAAGFPSMRHRGALAQEIGSVLRAEGWAGPILALGTRIEASSPTLWPDGIDGLVLRPTDSAG